MKSAIEPLSTGPAARRAARRIAGCLLAVAVGWAPPAPAADGVSPADRLEEAFYLEVAALDVEGAMAAYREVLADPAASPRVLAQAHLRLGICLELGGRTAEARSELEAVVSRFPREADAVALARRLLGEDARPDPAAFLPADLLAYAEVVGPAEHVGRIGTLLEGTPLRNPVDYYLSYLRRGQPAGDPTPKPEGGAASVPEIAAFLNEPFLSEVGKIDGLAVGIPGDRKAESDFLVVFLPGRSDILRGLVQMLVTLSRARGIGSVHGSMLLRTPPDDQPVPEDPDEWIHVAVGGEAVVLGRPRALVEDAVARRAGQAPSLATDPDFQRARAARAGSFLFSYVRRERLLEAVEASLPAEGRSGFDRLRGRLGLDGLDSLGFTAAHVDSGDSLRLTVRARTTAGPGEGWSVLRTPPIEPRVLRAVPADTVAFLAFALPDGDDREKAAASIGDLLGPALSRANEGARRLRVLLDSAAAAELWASLDTVVVGVKPEPLVPAPLWFFALLRFRDPERGAAALESFLVDSARSTFRNPASQAFADERLEVDGRDVTVRYLEPVPGLRLRCHRMGDLVALTTLQSHLSAISRARVGGSVPQLPPRARKVVYLRPSRLVELVPATDPMDPTVRWMLSEIPEVFLATREGEDSLALDLVLPGITPAARAIITRLAEEAARKEP